MFELLKYDFMQNAFIIGTILSIIGPIIWVFLIVRRYTMISDTLAHSSLAWITFWILMWYSPIITTLIYSTISWIIIEKLRLTKKLTWDMVLSIFLALNLWIVAIILSLNSKNFINISSYLFWSISLISRNEVYLISIISIFILIVLYAIRKRLLQTTYDEDNAQASWINTKLINILFIVIVSLIITISIPVTWILLLSALITIPVIISSQIAKSFKSTIFLWQFISFVCVNLWIVLSYFYDISASWLIILFLLLVLIFSLIYNKIKHLN